MEGHTIELWPFGKLNNLPQVHHRDPVGDMLHHTKVVGNEEVGQPKLILKLFQQIDDLSLDRDIERRDRLIADHKLGFDRECTGDTNTLALTT